MIFADYHVHTNFSTDADRSAAMETMVKSAIKRGLREIVITDHQDYVDDGLIVRFSADLDACMTELLRLKEKYADKINLLLGVEVGITPSQARVIEERFAKYPIDFIIGSSHDPPVGTPYYFAGYFEGKTKREAFDEYFSQTIANIRSTSGYDVYGHLDYIFRYSSVFNAYPENGLNYLDYADAIDEILKELISRGKGLELNTSGFKYGLNTVHPQPDILKRYRELGGEIIVIGSDAHAPEEIANGFDKAEAILKECGFTAYTLFRERKPIWEKF